MFACNCVLLRSPPICCSCERHWAGVTQNSCLARLPSSTRRFHLVVVFFCSLASLTFVWFYPPSLATLYLRAFIILFGSLFVDCAVCLVGRGAWLRYPTKHASETSSRDSPRSSRCTWSTALNTRTPLAGSASSHPRTTSSATSCT